MTFTNVNYDAVINHPSGDGEYMASAMQEIITQDNVHILSRTEFESKLSQGQIDYSCIDGRSVTEDNNKPVVHVAGDAYGLYIMAPMEALSDLGISKDLDDIVVTRFIQDNNIKPTAHSWSHSHGDDSIATCDCGHAKTNAIQLDENLLALSNKFYEPEVQLVGNHKEQAIIISPSKDTLVLVDTTNELNNGTMDTQAEHQVFWNDAGAIEVCIEYYANSFAKIISEVTGEIYTSDQIAHAWKNAYNNQLWRTVQALQSSKPLADAGKIFTISQHNETLVIASVV